MKKLIIDEREHDLTHEDLGWATWETEEGEVWVEYAVREALDSFPWSPVRLYLVPVPTDVYTEHDWVKDVSDEDRARGKAEDSRERAWAIYSIGEKEGWENLDGYPLELSLWELAQRWGVEPDFELPEGDAQVEATNAAFTLFHLGMDEGVDIAKALVKGMRRVRRTRGVTKNRWWDRQLMPKLISTFETDYPRQEHSVYLAVSLDCAEVEVGEVKRMESNPKGEV